MEKSELIRQYEGKVLAVRNYVAAQDKFWVKDFINLDKLDHILGEVCTSESDITPAGKAFIKQYYDIDELAEKLFKENNNHFFHEINAKSTEDIKKMVIRR